MVDLSFTEIFYFLSPSATRRSVPPIIGKAEVSFDYSSTEPNQINLQTGETVAVISKAGGDRGWWKGAVIINHHMGKPELGKVSLQTTIFTQQNARAGQRKSADYHIYSTKC